MQAAAPSSRSPDSRRRLGSPVTRSAWLLRACSLLAVAASTLGLFVVPGLRGNADESTVLAWEKLSTVASIGTGILVAALATSGAFDLARAAKVPLSVRVPTVTVGTVAIVLGMASMTQKLPPFLLAVMMINATVLALIASRSALRTPHARAPALVLLGTALASTSHFVAWELAGLGAERPALYGSARVAATGALALTALSQLVAATWISSRGRGVGKLGALVAMALAMAVVWGAGRGASISAAPWQAVLHTALDGTPWPKPFLADVLPAFFTASSLTLALAVALVPKQVPVLTATAALGLVGRSTLDVPMSALCAAAASVWLLLAASDDRAMWGELVSRRDDKRAR